MYYTPYSILTVQILYRVEISKSLFEEMMWSCYENEALETSASIRWNQKGKVLLLTKNIYEALYFHNNWDLHLEIPILVRLENIFGMGINDFLIESQIEHHGFAEVFNAGSV